MIKTCPQCNKLFKPPTKVGSKRKYCSKECYIQSKITQVEKICKTCGKPFMVIQTYKDTAKYCSRACQSTKVELTCEYCGRTFYEKRSHAHYRQTCSKSCQALLKERDGRSALRGRERSEEEIRTLSEKTRQYLQSNPTKHPWYVDGSYANGELKRGPSWQKQRKAARARDNYVCRSCGKSEDQLGKQLSVHHIRPYRLFASSDEANMLDNLVCVCQSCHWKIEHGSIPIPH